MAEQGWSVDDFIREFGRNHLDEEELTEDGYLREPEGGWDNPEAFQLIQEAVALPW